MPTYVYECAKCGDEFEQWQSFSDEPLKKHSGCGGKVVKVLQPVGILLKGPGFYRTDSRSAGANGRKNDRSEKSDAGSKSDSSSSASTSDSSPSTSESKSEKKTEKKAEAPKQPSTSTNKSS